MKLLKIGELAKMTGITVRTLHHYESIGLLSPYVTSDAGHRFYGEKEIERLQQIISLKSLGISLKEITQILQMGNDLIGILKLHHKTLLERLNQLQRIEKTLDALVKKFGANKKATTQELIRLIKELQNMENWEKFYTPEQIAKLKARYEKYPDQAKKVSEEWPKLFKKFEEALKRGLSPESEEVQILAKKAQHFIDLFTGRDRTIEKSLDQAYENPANKKQALKGMTVSEEVFDYANKARAYLKKL